MTQDIIRKIVYFAKRRETFVLISILKSSGSTPRTKGTTMLVSCNGENFGTIGGGLLEAKIVKYASEIVIKKQQICVMDINLSPEESGGIGMVCGGYLSIILDPISTGKCIEVFFSSCLDIIKQGHKCNFLTLYRVDKQSKKASHYLVYDNKILSDSNTPNQKQINLIEQYNTQFPNVSIANLNNIMIACSPIYIPKLYIIGAGHIAQPTAIMANIVGFSVIVMDDRQYFANLKRFPNVEAIKIVDFSNAFHDVHIESESFIVIITRGHIYDAIVLEQAILTNALYIGMIGSTKKRNSIFESLKKKGFKNRDIRRIHSPIGIDIGSETPEEIALSIVAEMVLVRSREFQYENVN